MAGIGVTPADRSDGHLPEPRRWSTATVALSGLVLVARRRGRVAGSRTARTLPTRRPSVDSTVSVRPSTLTVAPGVGHPAEAVEDEAADRVVLVPVLEQRLEVEVGPDLAEVVDRGAAVDPGPRVVEPDDHLLLGVVLVLDLADDLLEEVLDGHEAGRPAVLVEHDRDVDLAPLELVQQVVDGHALGHEHRRPEQGPEGRPRPGRRP